MKEEIIHHYPLETSSEVDDLTSTLLDTFIKKIKLAFAESE
jgi:hypothetical protein